MGGKNNKMCVYIVLVKCISQTQSHQPLVPTIDSAMMMLGNVQYDHSVIFWWQFVQYWLWYKTHIILWTVCFLQLEQY
jgi:hypothetical protein